MLCVHIAIDSAQLYASLALAMATLYYGKFFRYLVLNSSCYTRYLRVMGRVPSFSRYNN